MSHDVWSAEDRRFDASELGRFVGRLFGAVGCSRDDAELIASLAVATDLRGVYSHGCARVPGYVRWMLEGRVDPRGRPQVVRDSGAAISVDGGGSLGHVGLTAATELAIRRAASTGIAAAALGHSNHCGAMASYALQGLDRDVIVLATTNTMPTMAWIGGLDRILGINPVGILIPAARQRPIVIDTSFGTTALGRIAIHEHQGRALPEFWATDREGIPTRDPAVALKGLILPAGGHKGASMALVFGVLSALLSGSSYGTALGDISIGPRGGEDGQFVVAIHIAAFEDVGRFKERVDGIVEQIRASRPAPGVDRVLVPGDLEAAAEERYRREGVPLTQITIDALIEVADHVGVDATPLNAA